MAIDPLTTNKITIPGLAEIARNLLDSDQLVGHDGTDMRRITASRLKTYVQVTGLQTILVQVDGEAAVTVGPNRSVIYLPYNLDISDILASISVAGSTITEVDLMRNGTSIFGVNKLTIDANEHTSGTAATPPTITLPSATDRLDRLAVNVLQAGTGAAGLKLWLIGTIRP